MRLIAAAEPPPGRGPVKIMHARLESRSLYRDYAGRPKCATVPQQLSGSTGPTELTAEHLRTAEHCRHRYSQGCVTHTVIRLIPAFTDD